MIHEIAQMCADSKATIACWAMGLTQHKNGVAVIQEVVNLLMGGHIGHWHRRMSSPPAIRMFKASNSWYLEAPLTFLAKLEQGLQFELPRKHGYDVVHSIHAMEDGDVDVLICMGGNFLSATPDTPRTAKAIQTVGLTVQFRQIGRSHLVTEAIDFTRSWPYRIRRPNIGEQFVTEN